MKNLIPCGCGCTPVFIGVLFLLAGIFAFIFVGGIFSLRCERMNDGSGYCIYEKNSMFFKEEKSIKIADIKRVYLNESQGMKDDEGNVSTLYNVCIETNDQKLSLTPYASGDRLSKDEIVSKINVFLNDKTLKEVYVEQNDEGLGITFGLIACVVGSVLIFISLIIVVASFFFKIISKI